MPPISPFQNNVTALDDIAYDNSGFFVVADYIEHLKSCFRLAMQFYSHSLSIKRHHPDGVNAIYYNVYIQVICTCFIYILYIMHVTYSLFSTKRTKGLTDNCCDAVGLVAVANYAWGFGVENCESVFLRTQGSILSIFLSGILINQVIIPLSGCPVWLKT